MNKAQLVDALAEKLGDRRTAGAAVEGIVDVIVRTVNKGERVNITGFGVFERRARAARTARNPRTGEPVKVKKTNVPAFRAGTTFRDVIGGTKKLPKAVAGTSGSAGRSASSTARAAAASSAAAKPSAGKSTSPKAATAGAKASGAKASKATTSKTSDAKATASATKAGKNSGAAKKSGSGAKKK